LKPGNILRDRIRNLGLDAPRFKQTEDAVRWLGAVQSQDFGPAKWSIGERVKRATDATVDCAFQEGRILRTHILRPTWHFVLPEDIAWMLELTGPRVRAGNAFMDRTLGLDDDTLSEVHVIIRRSLAGGVHLTRKELAIAMTRGGEEPAGQLLGYIMMSAELAGLVCSGAMRGKQQTYALLEERAPGTQKLAPDEALAELTLRYFRSHGPATEKDFRWWSSLTLADIRRGLEMVAGDLEREVIDGTTYWFAPPVSARHKTAPRVHLLQGYDEYIVGYSESKHLLLPPLVPASPLATSSYNGVIILDGRVAGQWKRTIGAKCIAIEARLHTALGDEAMASFEDAVSRHGAFLGAEARGSIVGW